MPEITRQNILIITAHPDDEFLWFYAGIKQLSIFNDVSILCLTFDIKSERGNELLTAAKNLKIDVYFAGLVDTGIDHYLKGVQGAIKSFLSFKKKSYDIVVTHPPHGGEKPHPHHIQAFKECFLLSLHYKFKLAFFSERKMYPSEKREAVFIWTSRSSFRFLSDYLYHVLKRGHLLIFITEGISILRQLSLIFKKYVEFHELSFDIDYVEKKLALLNYESQIHVLEKYKAFSWGDTEFLYLEDR